MPEETVPDLYRLAFIPGCFRCPKCNFQLSKVTLAVNLGEMGTTDKDRDSEPCPNDGTIMVHITYRDRMEEYEKRLGEEFANIEVLRSQLASAEAEREEANKNYQAGMLRLAVLTEFASFVFSRGRDLFGRLCLSLEEEERARAVVNRV